MAIYVTITRKILPGKDQEFKESLRNFLGQSFIHDAAHGASIISSFPGADSKEIAILRTFKDEKERDDFYNSEQFQQLESYLSTLTEPAVYRLLTGLEAWFRSATPTPRWKMAIATLCVYFQQVSSCPTQPADCLKTCPAIPLIYYRHDDGRHLNLGDHAIRN